MNFYPNIIYWPRILQRDRSWKWELGARTVSGGRSLSGLMPTARFDGGGMWMAELGDVQVSSADHVRAWRALTARLDSGATPVVLEARDERFAPWPLLDGAPVVSPYTATFSDGATFSDETVLESEVIAAELVEDAALRATTITISLSNAEPLRGGEHFSIQHDTFSHRLYRVGKVVIDDDGNSVVTIRPPLREATAAGTRVEFDNPKCIMRLADPDAMDLMLERRIYGSASVKFVEDFPPFDLVEGDSEE